MSASSEIPPNGHAGSSIGDAVLAPPAFERILCATRGGRYEREAARQAAILAGGSGELTYLSIWFEEGRGLTAQASFNRLHAEEALRDAKRLAAESGAARVTTRAIESRDVIATLLAEAREYDLLVVGPPPASRAEGITFGRAATYAAHHPDVPLIIARRPPEGALFPGPILFATDGTRVSLAAAELTGRIARAHGATVIPVHVAHPGAPPGAHEIDGEMERVLAGTEHSATMVVEGSAVRMITAVATHERCPLIVLGSRGLAGVRALGSVSERVAHRARCSVLIAR